MTQRQFISFNFYIRCLIFNPEAYDESFPAILGLNRSLKALRITMRSIDLDEFDHGVYYSVINFSRFRRDRRRQLGEQELAALDFTATRRRRGRPDKVNYTVNLDPLLRAAFNR